jgi:hypothetical protein
MLVWKGSGNENINAARVTLVGNTAGGFGMGGLTASRDARSLRDPCGSWRVLFPARCRGGQRIPGGQGWQLLL